MKYDYGMIAFFFDSLALGISFIGCFAAIYIAIFKKNFAIRIVCAHFAMNLALYSFIQWVWMAKGADYRGHGAFLEIIWSLNEIMFVVDSFILIWLQEPILWGKKNVKIGKL